MLELARLLKEANPARTLRFVAFVNEEAPFYRSDAMGSPRQGSGAFRLHRAVGVGSFVVGRSIGATELL